MPHEKKVQVSKSEESHIDRDFQTLRDRFDEEMRRMDAEMSKFRGSLLDHSREIDSRPLSPSSRHREVSSFVDSIESPLIQESSDGKVLKLKFDVTDYEPEEIVVKTIGNKLQVYAKHEEKSDSRSVFREYNREFLLPDGTNPDSIKSSLSRDGVLTVEAPLPKSDHRKVPIDKY